MKKATFKIEDFFWNVLPHILQAKGDKLGIKRIEDLPDEITIVGRSKTITFVTMNGAAGISKEGAAYTPKFGEERAAKGSFKEILVVIELI